MEDDGKAASAAFFFFCYNGSMEHEILSPTPLLTAEKTLSTEGWARHPMITYSRKEAGIRSLHEIDSYLIADPGNAFILLMEASTHSAGSLHRIIYVDTERKQLSAVRSSRLVMRKEERLPEDMASDSEITYADPTMTMAAVKRGRMRRLLVTAPELQLPSELVGIKAHIELESQADEIITGTYPASEDRKRWILRSIESPMRAEGIMFTGHSPVMLSPSARGAFCFTREKLQDRFLATAVILGDGWSISAGKDEHINAIIHDGKIEKLDTAAISFYDGKWAIGDSRGQLEITAETLAAAEDGDRKDIFIRCSGSFRKEDGGTVPFSGALGMITLKGSR